jgi:5-methylcytosine-specific restriction enzyme subunit McrC
MILLQLREAESARAVPLTAEQARRLGASGVVEVRPGPGADTWLVGADRKVGAARIGDLELRIEPKVEVGQLLFLLGYARDPGVWREELLGVPPHRELIPALAATLCRQSERALRAGLLQGYRVIDESSAVLRGRLREADQLGRRFGLPHPLEIRHDEYTVDIAENRILATAATRMLRVPGVDPESRRLLRHHANRLADVTLLPSGAPVPTWQPTRLNARYHVALRLAELVLAGSSIDAGVGGVVSNGFLLDMWLVFEDFLSAALRRTLEARHGGAVTTQAPDHLDRDGRVGLRPDILWRRGGQAVAVVDAKYKAYNPAGDVYQMLAYCTVYGLSRGHLVYVTGDHPPVRHLVRNTDIEIVCHALDLSLPPPALLAAAEDLADDIASS